MSSPGAGVARRNFVHLPLPPTLPPSLSPLSPPPSVPGTVESLVGSATNSLHGLTAGAARAVAGVPGETYQLNQNLEELEVGGLDLGYVEEAIARLQPSRTTEAILGAVGAAVLFVLLLSCCARLYARLFDPCVKLKKAILHSDLESTTSLLPKQVQLSDAPEGKPPATKGPTGGKTMSRKATSAKGTGPLVTPPQNYIGVPKGFVLPPGASLMTPTAAAKNAAAARKAAADVEAAEKVATENPVAEKTPLDTQARPSGSGSFAGIFGNAAHEKAAAAMLMKAAPELSFSAVITEASADAVAAAASSAASATSSALPKRSSPPHAASQLSRVVSPPPRAGSPVPESSSTSPPKRAPLPEPRGTLAAPGMAAAGGYSGVLFNAAVLLEPEAVGQPVTASKSALPPEAKKAPPKPSKPRPPSPHSPRAPAVTASTVGEHTRSLCSASLLPKNTTSSPQKPAATTAPPPQPAAGDDFLSRLEAVEAGDKGSAATQAARLLAARERAAVAAAAACEARRVEAEEAKARQAKLDAAAHLAAHKQRVRMAQQRSEADARTKDVEWATSWGHVVLTQLPGDTLIGAGLGLPEREPALSAKLSSILRPHFGPLLDAYHQYACGPFGLITTAEWINGGGRFWADTRRCTSPPRARCRTPNCCGKSTASVRPTSRTQTCTASPRTAGFRCVIVVQPPPASTV